MRQSWTTDAKFLKRKIHPYHRDLKHPSTNTLSCYTISITVASQSTLRTHVDGINRAAAGGVVLQTRLVLGSEREGPGPHWLYLAICSSDVVEGCLPCSRPLLLVSLSRRMLFMAWHRDGGTSISNMRMYDFLSPTFFAINYIWAILRSVGKHPLVLTPHPSPNKKTLSLYFGGR